MIRKYIRLPNQIHIHICICAMWARLYSSVSNIVYCFIVFYMHKINCFSFMHPHTRTHTHTHFTPKRITKTAIISQIKLIRIHISFCFLLFHLFSFVFDALNVVFISNHPNTTYTMYTSERMNAERGKKQQINRLPIQSSYFYRPFGAATRYISHEATEKNKRSKENWLNTHSQSSQNIKKKCVFVFRVYLSTR